MAIYLDGLKVVAFVVSSILLVFLIGAMIYTAYAKSKQQ